MLDIMIDLETLDTTPYCTILTIGVVSFNPKGMGIVEKLELKPTIEDQTEIHNRVINEDTLKWLRDKHGYPRYSVTWWITFDSVWVRDNIYTHWVLCE